MNRLLFVIPFCLALNLQAYAQDVGVYADALKNGTAQTQLPYKAPLDRLTLKLQQITHDAGPILVKAERIKYFQQQSHCGRVRFILFQPSSNTAWPELGGQLNICEDGSPPWRICKSNPMRLVLHTERCSDGSTPVDTPEVEQAIKEAVASGSALTPPVVTRREAGRAALVTPKQQAAQ